MRSEWAARRPGRRLGSGAACSVSRCSVDDYSAEALAGQRSGLAQRTGARPDEGDSCNGDGSDESCTIDGVEPGTWTVVVLNYMTSGSAPDVIDVVLAVTVE